MREIIDLRGYINDPATCDKESAKIETEVAFSTMKSRGFIKDKKLLPGFTKYGVFFATMLLGRKLTDIGKIASSGYFHLRFGDERADGAQPVPEGFKNAAEYLQNTKTVLYQVTTPDFHGPILGHRSDILLVNTINQAKAKGLDLTQEYSAIQDTMIFDEERRRTGRIPTQAELDKYWRDMDTGCVSGALKIAGEKIDAKELGDLSIATRTMFSIRDFVADLKDGIVNISKEDVLAYGVDIERCRDMSEKQLLNYRPMRLWFKDQTELGLSYFERSKDQMTKLSLKTLTKAVLKVNFENPTKKGLNRFQRLLAA